MVKIWLPWSQMGILPASAMSCRPESGLPRGGECPRHHSRTVKDRPGEEAGESAGR